MLGMSRWWNWRHPIVSGPLTIDGRPRNAAAVSVPQPTAHLSGMPLYRCEVLSPVTDERYDFALDLAARVSSTVSEVGIEDVDVRWDTAARVASVQVCFVADADEKAHQVAAALNAMTGVIGGIDVVNLRTGRGRSHRRVAA